MAKGSDFQETLKPFYQRAAEAEERLSRLEAALESKKGAGNADAEKEELLKTICELQGKLEDANTEILSFREKEKKLVAEIEKLKYREVHLVRAVREADQKLDSMKGCDLKATVETTKELEKLKI
ncbi:hypothetical protein SLE2022_062160 [Rubroshorea leprosula]|uniref:Uncharacterized protein n=1 Tax=Rubroshorea leprosula TaxID=152421 RepID=A0AAV5KT18_9ROSI|nr:hypothetical protein SLEP1_g36781 [Rubroshorea leprosula]